MMQEQIAKGLLALLTTGQDSDTVSEILRPFLPADHYVRCNGNTLDVYHGEDGSVGSVVASFKVLGVVVAEG
jgi:hypothetical protein